MHMRWFGESWGAPICKEVKHIETPKGVCIECTHPIKKTDQGYLIPFSGAIGNELFPSIIIINGEPHLIYHLSCFLQNLGVR
jgi:hypothetical protein